MSSLNYGSHFPRFQLLGDHFCETFVRTQLCASYKFCFKYRYIAIATLAKRIFSSRNFVLKHNNKWNMTIRELFFSYQNNFFCVTSTFSFFWLILKKHSPTNNKSKEKGVKNQNRKSDAKKWLSNKNGLAKKKGTCSKKSTLNTSYISIGLEFPKLNF